MRTEQDCTALSQEKWKLENAAKVRREKLEAAG
jgi:hypothetical protein